jgi:hypothetical protein
MSKRTDCHRVGAIVPEQYRLVLSYSRATTEDNMPVPAFGINCEIERRKHDKEGNVTANGEHNANGLCCVVGLLHVAKVRFAEHGCLGTCTICGAAFNHGDVWVHEPTGEHIHVGHTCADKYQMLAERGDYDARYETHKRMTAAHRLAAEGREERAAFLAERPGLADALKADHDIIANIAEKFIKYRTMSDAQVALVMKIANELANPKPAEVNVPAPEGRVTYRGVVVSTKAEESGYGGRYGAPAPMSYKMTVKVTTPEGTWLAWTTIPSGLLDDANEKLANTKGLVHHLKGCEVELTSTLTRSGDKPHFAFGKKPSKARIVTVPAGAEKKPREEDCVDPATEAMFAEFAA